MFVYFSDRQEFNRDFRGPDFFVVNGGVERDKERVSWVAWEENSRLPDAIIELLSPKTKAIDRGEKKDLYEKRLKTHEYFCFDPATDLLEGWRLENGKGYVAIPLEPAGGMWSQELKVFLNRWDGKYLDLNGRWLRFFRNDKVLLTFKESESLGRVKAESKAKAAEVKAKAAQEKAKAAEEKAKAEVKARKVAEAELELVKSELAALRKKRK